VSATRNDSTAFGLKGSERGELWRDTGSLLLPIACPARFLPPCLFSGTPRFHARQA